MIKKLFKAAAHGVNVAALCGMVGVGAFYWTEAEAEHRMRTISQEDLHCLQQNIYFESRNQSTLGQRAVAWVTVNRMEDSRWPTTICEVVWQPRQFSWTHDGKPDEPGANTAEQRAWARAGLIARSVVHKWARGVESPVEDAVMFHADYVTPYWTADFNEVASVDDHIFYN